MNQRKFCSTRRSLLRSSLSLAAASVCNGALAKTFASPEMSSEIHVSPRGRDDAAGSLQQPVKTLGEAIQRAAKLGAVSRMILLHEGTYEMTQGTVVSVKATSTAPLMIRSVVDQKVILTAAKKIDPTAFQVVTDVATLARIPKELHGKIVSLDLEHAKINHVRKYPDVFTDNGGLIELFANERRMPLARYPKTGYMQIKEVVTNGGGMESSGDWKTFYSNGAPVDQRPRPGVFVYRDERTARWASALERGVWLKGYWRVSWQNEAVRVAAIDAGARTVTLAAPVPGGIGNKYHRPKGSGEENYWSINPLEELSTPGEWCVDFADNRLYFYPPSPIEQLDIRIADNTSPVIALRDAEYVRIEQVTVSGSRVDGVAIQGGRENRVAGCTVRNTTSYGLRVDGGIKHEVRSCDIYATGAGAVWLGGGDEKSVPRVPAGHRVVNNHIHHFGEIERVYAPAVNAGFTGGGGGGHHEAVGMYVANNLIHDGPHAGVLHGSWDHVFEYNEIFRVCTVSNDMGYFYCFDNYDRSGSRTFRYNFMHNSPLADGIYFDRDNREDKVYGNLVHVAGTGFLYKLGNMADDTLKIFCWNNIAVGCTTGFRFAMRKGSDVHGNVAVQCRTPYVYLTGDGGKGPSPQGDVSTGKNLSFVNDPGFMNAAGGDFAFRSDVAWLKEIAFEPLPWKKIGMYRDEYRRTLPTDAEVRRFENPGANGGSAYDIQDR